MWKSDKPVSITLEILKIFGLFVINNSTHEVLCGFWKQVLSLIILWQLQTWQKSLMRCSHGSELKSPSKMKLSYLDENRSQYLPITARCFVIKVLLDCMSNITISFYLWLTLHKKLQSRNQFSKGWKEHLILRKVVSHPLFHPGHIYVIIIIIIFRK